MNANDPTNFSLPENQMHGKYVSIIDLSYAKYIMP